MIDERDEKLIELVQKDAPSIKRPKCPKCSHTPLEFVSNVVRTGMGHMVSIIWCGNCGHTLQAQFLGIDQQEQQQTVIVKPS